MSTLVSTPTARHDIMASEGADASDLRSFIGVINAQTNNQNVELRRYSVLK